MNPPLAFALMCLAWGSTFVALKVAAAVIPPVFLSGVRFVLAAGLILAWFMVRRVAVKVSGQDRWRLAGFSLLSIVLGYGLGFWSISYLSSGLAAVVNFSSVSLSILGFSLLLSREKATSTKLLSIGIGITGLVLLFAPNLSLEQTNQQAMAILVMALGSSVYGLSTVLLRPFAAKYSPLVITSSQMLPGGSALLLVGWWLELSPGWSSLEPVLLQTLQNLLMPSVAFALLYLVLAGSILGLTLYYYLLARWPATRVSSYTFVCPIIALVLGAVLLGEQVTPLELMASFILLCGAALALRA
jgi:drug/metabolite transporter (DMT)-like permease